MSSKLLLLVIKKSLAKSCISPPNVRVEGARTEFNETRTNFDRKNSYGNGERTDFEGAKTFNKPHNVRVKRARAEFNETRTNFDRKKQLRRRVKQLQRGGKQLQKRVKQLRRRGKQLRRRARQQRPGVSETAAQPYSSMSRSLSEKPSMMRLWSTRPRMPSMRPRELYCQMM